MEPVTTLTEQVSVKPPSAVVTRMVAVPTATPLTSPEDDTVAQPLGDELATVHVTDLFVAPVGVIVAVKDDELPTGTSRVSGIETPVTATGAAAPTVSVKELR